MSSKDANAAARLLRERKLDQLQNVLGDKPELYFAHDRKGATLCETALASFPTDEETLLAVWGKAPLAALEAKQRHGTSLAGQAAEADNILALRLLRDLGVDLCAADATGHAPIHIAAQQGRCAALRFLCEAGAAAATDSHGYNAFHWLTLACEPDEPAVILAGFLDINTPGISGRTALHQAVLNGAAGAAKALLQAGADPDAQDDSGLTPLALATQKSANEIMDALCEAGADINLPDHCGNAPLDYAIAEGYQVNIIHLAGKGADFRRPDADGATPLMRLAANGFTSSALYLLSLGADPFATDPAGRNAFDYAKASNHAGTLESMLADAEQRLMQNELPAPGEPGAKLRI